MLARAIVFSCCVLDAQGLRTVRDFGARGDGRTDDTAAIQRAADSGDAVFPRGRYKISRPIRVQLDKTGPASFTGLGTATLLMAGVGPAIHLIGTHSGTADPATVTPSVRDRQRAPTVQGIEIVGLHRDSDGIRAEGTIHAVFTRLTIRGARNGIVLTGRNRNVIVSDSHIYENRGAGILMERLNLHQVNISNSHVSYNAGGGIVVRESEIRNLQITGCDIEANMSPDGPSTANVLIDASAGAVREGAITGCTLQHSPNGKDTANIRLIGHSAEVAHKVGFFSITGNAISDTGTNIHLRYARGVSISGNTLWAGRERDILVEHSSRVTIGTNVLDRNPDYKEDARGGIHIRDSSEVSIHGISVSGAVNPALHLERVKRANVTGCTIVESGAQPIRVEESAGVRIVNCDPR